MPPSLSFPAFPCWLPCFFLNTAVSVLLREFTHASKYMLKILQMRLHQYENQKLPDIQAAFRKGRGTRNQIANICWIIEKAREFQKNSYFCFLDYTKIFVWITTNCGKFLKDGNTRPLYLPPEKSVCKLRSNS